jgi:LPXTG-motif cell wall-anchored protein
MNVANIKRVCRLCLQVVCAGLLSMALLPQLHADEWSKSTKFTFKDPVQIPGQVLPAGTYVFRLLNSKSDRHVVQVWDENDQHLLATVIAIPDYRIEAKGGTTLKFSERSGSADAIKEWFYPGDNFGQEFVYPKGEELQTAEVTPPAPVTAPPAEATPAPVEPAPPAQETPQETQQETPPAAEPEQQPAPPAAATPAPEEPEPAPAEPESLPQTGSELPLIGLLGFTSLGSGVLSRILRRR